MQVIGIVAEYDPFHTGHACHIARTRQALGGESAVIAVMSGNWVQRSSCAVADKWTRARMALMGGVDLVLELPTVWATSTAETFARGAVGLLHASGVVSCLSFGSECGEVEPLRKIAAYLNSTEYETEVKLFLEAGIPFAAARQAAVAKGMGDETARLLSRPNDNLGVEYLRALRHLGSQILPIAVRRSGAGHGSLEPPGEEDACVSASWLREQLRSGRREEAEPFLISGTLPLLPQAPDDLPDPSRIERAVLTRLRSMTASDWAALPDAGAAEGLPRRLEQAGRQCVSMEDFFTLAKTKRYSHARLRRLVLWAFLGLTAADVPPSPPYLRVLGFNRRGQALLREMKGTAALPVLTKPAHVRCLSGASRRLFRLEARCTDLYDLCLERVPIPGREWTAGPVRLDIE